MAGHFLKRIKPSPHTLPRVRWHQWSVVRLAGVAMFTVIVGYLNAAVLAVKSIDQLLHMVHDNSVEQALKTGLEGVKDAYKTRQELLIEKLKSKLPDPFKATSEQINIALQNSDTPSIMKQNHWTIENQPRDILAQKFEWMAKQKLAIGHFSVTFEANPLGEEYRRSEEVLQRYQIVGLQLRDRIRPALIKALSITLAIICLLLMIAFTYMAIRGKNRIKALVSGFVRYAERDDSFRFQHHWHNELGLLSRQFNYMADELDKNKARAIGLEKLASWQTIARKMAHEIKNPLTPIQIMISQIKRHYEGNDHEYEVLLEKAHNVILEEVASLRRMVDDFSQFARLPSPRFAEGNAVYCATQTIALAEGSYAPHSVIYEGPVEDVPAIFDEQLIRHALHNLIKNAAEADPESSTPIILRLIPTPTHVHFEVEDHGPGIPDDLKNSIFEAYVTTKHTGPNPGMGLGLAICQKIILEHEGKLSLESSPGKTIFKVSIPRTRKGIKN